MVAIALRVQVYFGDPPTRRPSEFAKLWLTRYDHQSMASQTLTARSRLDVGTWSVGPAVNVCTRGGDREGKHGGGCQYATAAARLFKEIDNSQ